MENSKKNWLKNLIFEEVDAESEQPDKPANAEAPASGTNQKTPEQNISGPNFARITPVDPASVSGTIDQNLLDKLCAVLDQQNTEGINYLKFKKSVDSLKDFQPEESVRFTTAFITLRATNPSLSKESIIATIDKYTALMEEERRAGMAQLGELRERSVGKKEKELADAIKRVEKLKEEIKGLTTFITETDAEISVKKNEFIVKEANFNATVDTIVNQMKTDKTKIETIINR